MESSKADTQRSLILFSFCLCSADQQMLNYEPLQYSGGLLSANI